MGLDAAFPVLTAREMGAAEQRLFDAGISVDALMLRAGEGAGQWIWRIGGARPTLVACGPGNNGGDGYVIAEFLRKMGCDVMAAAAAPPKTDAAKNAAAAYRGEVLALADAKPRAQLVDCLFGTGLSRPVDARLWEPFDRLARGADRHFAVDLPSGIAADSGELLNEVRTVDHCIALGAYKFAQLLQPSAAKMRDVRLVDIGVEREGFSAYPLASPRLTAPATDAHKYRRGMVAIVSGAMPGAAILAAKAAQAAGAGYVKIFAPDVSMAAAHPDIVWEQAASPDALAGRLSDKRIGAVLVGPGLGRDDAAKKTLAAVVAAGHPLVADADALHIWYDVPATRNRDLPAILTPHDGEFAALGGASEGSKVENARALARDLGVVLLHKGPDSVIAAPEGMVRIAAEGSPWLSVAGSGDVLAGAIAARLAASGDGMQAACEGQWLQQRASRLAAAPFSAADLAAAIRRAFAEALA